MGDPVKTIKMDKSLFTDHMDFWRQIVRLDQAQRMLLWGSIQRQAYKVSGLDYDWDKAEPVPVLPQQDEPTEPIEEGPPGHYL